MIKRKVYRAKKTGLVSITIPGKMMKRWGIEGLQEVMINEIAPGMFKMWAPIGEINRLGIGKEEVDNSPGTPDNEG